MMKKLLLALSCLVFIGFTANAQQDSIPNADFEQWIPSGSYDTPLSWATENVLVGFGNPVSVYKDSINVEHGHYAMKIKTVALINNPASGQIPDTLGVAFTGTISFSSINFGFDYAKRPTDLKFYAEYVPNGADTAYAQVVLQKWNNTTSSRDTIGIGRIRILSTPNYTVETVPITYADTATPDTATVFFSSSSNFKPKVGSALWVDHSWFDVPLGINEAHAVNNIVKAYPNPATNALNISVSSQKAYEITVFDITGQKIKSYTIKNRRAKIPVSTIAPGIYIYQIFDKNHGVMNTGKFNVIR